ncbi:MAG TPA: glycosyltransferase [Chitinophagaceae bacterium]|nr:glycosyltransferase [Chitinophagaceae bacterium]
MPKISVILPVYNGGKYLIKSVLSVLDQSLTDFEFLILDDCSKDGSWKYLNSIQDKRVYVFKNETNKGLFYNLNFLIKKSASPLIKLWSQDDVMLPNALAEIVAFHQQLPNIGFSYTAVDYIDENDVAIIKPVKIDTTPTVIDTELHAKISFESGSIAGNIANVTLSKPALDKVGLFNEAMRMSGDFEMWVRIAQYYDTGFLNKPLIILRDHSGQLSRAEKYNLNVLEEDISVYKYLFKYVPEPLKKYGKEHLRNNRMVYFFTLMLKTLMKGKIVTALQFWKSINKMDNGFILSYYFIKNKLLFSLTRKGKTEISYLK